MHTFCCIKLLYKKRLLNFTSDGLPVKAFALKVGTFGYGNLEFNQPIDIGIHPVSKEVYVADYNNDRIQVLDCELNFSRMFQPSDKVHFKQPWAVALDSKGQVYVADAGNHCIIVFEEDGTYVKKFGHEGKEEGKLSWPSSFKHSH